MRGFLAYVLGVASVAALIPWPGLWPATAVALVVAWVLCREADSFVVAELVRDGEVVACWTGERPGVTGPRDLEATAHLLDPDKGWRVRRATSNPRARGGNLSKGKGF